MDLDKKKLGRHLVDNSVGTDKFLISKNVTELFGFIRYVSTTYPGF